MTPVPVPPIKEGQDARLVAAHMIGALKTANGKLTASGNWYDKVRECYAHPDDKACKPAAK